MFTASSGIENSPKWLGQHPLQSWVSDRLQFLAAGRGRGTGAPLEYHWAVPIDSTRMLVTGQTWSKIQKLVVHWCYVMLCFLVSLYVMSCYFMSCFLCYVMFSMICYVISCHVMLCYVCTLYEYIYYYYYIIYIMYIYITNTISDYQNRG